MTKISIIVPVYNTAKYLNECLDSVLSQSFTDFEVLCTNDGSSDNSMDILKGFESMDSRIKILNQSNKGLSAARNTAMKYASGDYILFLDSDDYLEEGALEILYNMAISKSLDLILFKIINFDDKTYKKSKYNYFEMNFLKEMVGDEVFNWEMVKSRLFDISVTAYGKFYRHDIIEGIEFPEGLIFEDNLYFFKTIFKQERIYFYDEYLYNRRLRDDSIIHSYFEKHSDCIEIYDLITDTFKKMNKYDEFSVQLFNRRCRDIFTRFRLVREDYKEEFFSKIKENFQRDENILKSEGTLKDSSPRSLEIFYSAINSNSYKEFESSVMDFDLKKEKCAPESSKSNSKKSYENRSDKINQENEIEKKSDGLKIIKNLKKMIINHF